MNKLARSQRTFREKGRVAKAIITASGRFGFTYLRGLEFRSNPARKKHGIENKMARCKNIDASPHVKNFVNLLSAGSLTPCVHPASVVSAA